MLIIKNINFRGYRCMVIEVVYIIYLCSLVKLIEGIKFDCYVNVI